MTIQKYRSFEDFTREEIRPGLRVGWSLDNIHDPTDPEQAFDVDPFETALLEAELDEDESDEDESDE